jgi:mannose-6-phosphate isomerase-like protein (cupin superfamily)
MGGAQICSMPNPIPTVISPDSRKVLQAGGNRITLSVKSEETGGAFSSICFEVAPGFVAPPAFHANTREDWWGQVLEGEVAIELLDGTTMKVSPGGWLFMPRGTSFRWWNARQEPARWQLTYAPGGFDGYFVELVEAIGEKKLTPPQMAEVAGPLWAKYGVTVQRKG